MSQYNHSINGPSADTVHRQISDIARLHKVSHARVNIVLFDLALKAWAKLPEADQRTMLAAGAARCPHCHELLTESR